MNAIVRHLLLTAMVLAGILFFISAVLANHFATLVFCAATVGFGYAAGRRSLTQTRHRR